MLTHRRKEKVSEPITRLLFVLYLTITSILIVSICIALHVVHSLYGLLINFTDLSHTASLLKGTQPRFRARKPRKTGLITVELQKAFPELNEQLQEEAAVKPGG